MIELLRTRRSIRDYKGQPIEREKLELLKEAVLRSPSSRNLDPWEFIFVDDRQLLQKLAACKPHRADRDGGRAGRLGDPASPPAVRRRGLAGRSRERGAGGGNRSGV